MRSFNYVKFEDSKLTIVQFQWRVFTASRNLFKWYKVHNFKCGNISYQLDWQAPTLLFIQGCFKKNMTNVFIGSTTTVIQFDILKPPHNKVTNIPQKLYTQYNLVVISGTPFTIIITIQYRCMNSQNCGYSRVISFLKSSLAFSYFSNI